jgi:hypothetical protein
MGNAECELCADPRRSDAIIALAACCTAQHVGRVRRRLTASGVLERGQLVDVEPGSALVANIGTENLTDATAADLASSANGTGGQVSN